MALNLVLVPCAYELKLVIERLGLPTWSCWPSYARKQNVPYIKPLLYSRGLCIFYFASLFFERNPLCITDSFFQRRELPLTWDVKLAMGLERKNTSRSVHSAEYFITAVALNGVMLSLKMFPETVSFLLSDWPGVGNTLGVVCS